MSRKTIIICDKECEVEVNAYTRFLYKKVFNTGMLNDFKILNDVKIKQEEMKKELKKQKMKEEEINNRIGAAFLEYGDDFLDVVLKIAYILMLTANKNMEPFEEWLQSIPELNLSDKWISEVTELAANSFHG